MRKIEGIVIHRGEIDATNREYHVLAQPDGSRVRLAPDYVIVPHARHWNATTLALCVFGDFASAEKGRHWTPTEAQYQTVIDQIAEWRGLYGSYGPLWVKGHSELGSSGTAYPEKLRPGHTCPGERFDLARIR
jgi:hypothetical protein